MTGFQHHIFVCVNERPAGHPSGCCLHRGGEAVRLAFKEEIERRGLAGKIRANKAGCMDHCEHGVAVVIYPENIWYGHVTEGDVPEILDRLLDGAQVVERLLIERSSD
ncbi:MAG: (2Fe-2S) ferredoxin domain-containing protein [Planctomycetota bacterium]